MGFLLGRSAMVKVYCVDLVNPVGVIGLNDLIGHGK